MLRMVEGVERVEDEGAKFIKLLYVQVTLADLLFGRFGFGNFRKYDKSGCPIRTSLAKLSFFCSVGDGDWSRVAG